MDPVRWDKRPALRHPVLIAAFEGWNDAGDGASSAARYLADAWSARPFATIDPEDFYDFSETRPLVRLADIPSASLWATVPHYVAQTPSPKATLALVRRTATLLGTGVETVDLEIAAASYERQVTDVVETDEEVSAYVHRLEEADDTGELDADEDAATEQADVPGGDAIAAEAEQFLRDQSDSD